MKINNKYLPLILLATFCLLLSAPTTLAADPIKLTPDCDATLPPNSPGSGKTGPCNIVAFMAWVNKIIKYMFIIAVPLATGFIVYGAFVMMKSGGNPGEFANGKKIIYSAVIGIIIMFTSSLIITTVVSVLKGATN